MFIYEHTDIHKFIFIHVCLYTHVLCIHACMHTFLIFVYVCMNLCDVYIYVQEQIWASNVKYLRLTEYLLGIIIVY